MFNSYDLLTTPRTNSHHGLLLAFIHQKVCLVPSEILLILIGARVSDKSRSRAIDVYIHIFVGLGPMPVVILPVLLFCRLLLLPVDKSPLVKCPSHQNTRRQNARR